MLDVTKDFDSVNYVKLLTIYLQRQLLVVCVRLLSNMYTSHVTRVAWIAFFPSYFSLQNGVKHLTMLCRRNFRIAFILSVDIVLLAPPARAINSLLSLYGNHANWYNIVLNDNKSVFISSFERHC